MPVVLPTTAATPGWGNEREGGREGMRERCREGVWKWKKRRGGMRGGERRIKTGRKEKREGNDDGSGTSGIKRLLPRTISFPPSLPPFLFTPCDIRSN